MNFLRAFAQSPSPQLTDRQREGGRERGMPEMMTMAPRTTDADGGRMDRRRTGALDVCQLAIHPADPDS